MAAEGASLVEAVLATNSRGATLIDVVAGFGIVAELVTHRACALGPKWPLNTAVGAAGIVVRAALLV